MDTSLIYLFQWNVRALKTKAEANTQPRGGGGVWRGTREELVSLLVRASDISMACTAAPQHTTGVEVKINQVRKPNP